MVTMVLYITLIPDAPPVAAWMFLPCRMSKTTIMRVRRTLSETEITKYGKPKKVATGVWGLFHPQACPTSIMIPIAIGFPLAQSVAAGPWGIQMRTRRAKVHETREGNNPAVPRVYHVATKELAEEPT